MRTDDLVVSIAYFSIPVQLMASLYRYPRLQQMPFPIVMLLILFALFILLCGCGHVLRCSGSTNGPAYATTNFFTAVVSLVTALYLLPLVPNLMSTMDKTLQDLIELNEETEKSKRQLKSFMAFLCHELRTPLFAITSSVSFLQEDELTADQINSLESIQQSSDLMLRIVNDVLDISSLESAKFTLEILDFDLRNMMNQLHRSMGMKCRNRHGDKVQLRFHMSDRVPRAVRGDSTRVMQVVLNLLSNAIKFTEAGLICSSIDAFSVEEALQKGLILSSSEREHLNGDSHVAATKDEFSVSLLQASVEEGRAAAFCPTIGTTVLQLKVQDTGIGIPHDRLDSIFEPFCQSKLSHYRKYGGTGLGLAIISKLVNAMGGKIFVKSTVDEGSTFEVYIPLPVVAKLYGGTSSPDTSQDIQICPYTLHNLLNDVTNEAVSDPVPTGHADELSVAVSQSLSTPPLIAPLLPSEAPTSAALVLPSTTGPPTSPTKVKRMKPSLPKFELPPNQGLVLIVDDNAMNRKMLSRMLSNFNLEYKQAADGQEAVDIMLSSKNYTGNPNAPHFGLILMDLSMPVLDGCEATAIIRNHNLRLPILALTAATIEEDRNKAFEAGVTEYATKPILQKDLHAKCVNYLSCWMKS